VVLTSGATAWQWVVVCFAFGSGVLLGIVVAQAIGRRLDRHADLRAELERVKAEHQAYRNEVYSHFAKTAELFQEMTDTYRGVYEHLATGASELCEDGQLRAPLDFPEARLLRDRQSGPAPDTAQTDSSRQPSRETPLGGTEPASAVSEFQDETVEGTPPRPYGRPRP
jgi:uncharacterized membrane-anchored protein YhcB (DUF1043 family)